MPSLRVFAGRKESKHGFRISLRGLSAATLVQAHCSYCRTNPGNRSNQFIRNNRYSAAGVTDLELLRETGSLKSELAHVAAKLKTRLFAFA
ncbi:hypothetical protein LF1_21760 [Rubripirellula obstinata]|uniref:Uncharacterized protein n=1 Tax=Rubripirellula obstinata TaxID=406547 RepID=A0A5B1CHE7_9BACT|nr:hypothetical protein LF1_21760 [Rubripirellula obstinata]